MAGRKKIQTKEKVISVVHYEEVNGGGNKQELFKVTALQWYSNGDVESNWARGETRYLPAWKIKRLEADLPGNWIYG